MRELGYVCIMLYRYRFYIGRYQLISIDTTALDPMCISHLQAAMNLCFHLLGLQPKDGNMLGHP